MKPPYAIAAAICLAAAGLTGLAQSPRQPQAGAAPPGAEDDETAELERRIDNTVRARAGVISLQMTDIVCRVPGDSAILELVENGGHVKQGDVLARLDDSAWKDKATAQEAAILAAQAAVEQAKAALELRQQDRSDGHESGELAVKAAEAAREKHLGKGGEHELQLKAIDAEIALAQERIKSAEAILKAALEAAEAGGAAAERAMIARQSAEARLAIFEAQTALKTAEAKKQWLATRELAHQKAVLDLAMAQAKAALNHTIRQTAAAVAQAQADLKAREAALVQETLGLARTRSILDHCTLRSPREGVVLYASSARRTSGAVEPGAKVQEGQRLMQMPDLSRLGLRVMVNESRIARVRVGQSVAIEPLVGRSRLRGKVIAIANQSDQRSWLSSDVREYAVTVALEDGAPSQLRLGMTALAEIDVAGTSPK